MPSFGCTSPSYRHSCFSGLRSLDLLALVNAITCLCLLVYADGTPADTGAALLPDAEEEQQEDHAAPVRLFERLVSPLRGLG